MSRRDEWSMDGQGGSRSAESESDGKEWRAIASKARKALGVGAAHDDESARDGKRERR